MNANNKQNVTKRRFNKFSVKSYRRILKAWMTSTESPASDSDETSGQLNDTLVAIDDKSEHTLKETNKTIQLSDSLESIPESPEIVEKRKSMERKEKTKDNKRSVSKFIDFEAEVEMDSKDSFCDDFENKDLDNYSQSAIDDILPMDTQPIGQLIGGIDSRSAKDMQTVYLRSVKEELIGKTDKYKLQYNYDPNIDVFSQEPNESDFEDYEFDSFCVSNDTIEMMDESSPQSTTVTPFKMSTPVQTQKQKRKKFKRIVFSP